MPARRKESEKGSPPPRFWVSLERPSGERLRPRESVVHVPDPSRDGATTRSPAAAERLAREDVAPPAAGSGRIEQADQGVDGERAVLRVHALPVQSAAVLSLGVGQVPFDPG